MHIFEPIEPPRGQARLALNRQASWHSWSADVQSLLPAWERQARRLRSPRQERLLGGTEYDDTFSLGPTAVEDRGLAHELSHFAEALYRLKVPGRIMLLDGMLCRGLSGRGLHFLFAYLREALVAITGDPLCALHQPLYRQSKGSKDFPLHADLYVPRVLFNVFDEVPNDGSGASTFLPVRTFLQVLPGIRTLDEGSRRRIKDLIRSSHREDRYEEFFRLLHGGRNAWRRELEKAMASRQLAITLRPGQGYLIDDRKWLHGRESPSGPVTRRRLHRLIFNTKEFQGPMMESPTSSVRRHRSSRAAPGRAR